MNARNVMDLLDDMSLKDAFWQFVLRDPKVERLGREAIKTNPDLKRVYEGGWCYPAGRGEWPVVFNEGSLAGGWSQNSPIGYLEGPPPPEVQQAADAVCLRYASLLASLKDGKLIALGDSVRSRGPDQILPSIWSHRSYYFDAINGDLLQINNNAADLNTLFVRRWRAVLLKRSPMFHGKPLVSDLDRAPTLEPQQVLKPLGKAGKRVETAAASKQACKEWLITIMQASPKRRTETINALWIVAQKKWPRSLSKRAFLAARTEAIHFVGANAWAEAGAPKKLKQKSPR